MGWKRILVVALLVPSTAGCALKRGRIKTLRDDGAAHIDFTRPVVTTVSALNALPARCGPAGNRRKHEQEFLVYQVTGRITRAKREPDHDVHLILADPDRPQDHMIVELPDADWRGGARSPYRERLRDARRMFEEMLADLKIQRVRDLKGTLVRVTGVGFYDINHLQIGRSRSCFELHPVLAIERIR